MSHSGAAQAASGGAGSASSGARLALQPLDGRVRRGRDVPDRRRQGDLDGGLAGRHGVRDLRGHQHLAGQDRGLVGECGAQVVTVRADHLSGTGLGEPLQRTDLVGVLLECDHVDHRLAGLDRLGDRTDRGGAGVGAVGQHQYRALSLGPGQLQRAQHAVVQQGVAAQGEGLDHGARLVAVDGGCQRLGDLGVEVDDPDEHVVRDRVDERQRGRLGRVETGAGHRLTGVDRQDRGALDPGVAVREDGTGVGDATVDRDLHAVEVDVGVRRDRDQDLQPSSVRSTWAMVPSAADAAVAGARASAAAAATAPRTRRSLLISGPSGRAAGPRSRWSGPSSRGTSVAARWRAAGRGCGRRRRSRRCCRRRRCPGG